jgi:hypothetical protein
MYYNPSYMNPIAQQPMQQEFSQQPTQEPLEGIASLAPTQPTQPIPTQPSQPIPPQMTEGMETLDTSNPTGDALVHQIQMRMQQQDVKPPAWNAYAKDVMDTGGYPTKTMQEYYNQFGDNRLQPLPVDPSNPTLIGYPPDSMPTVPQVPGAIQKGLLGEPITPYVRNENLDLTDRSGIMGEYSKYIQGGMGSRAHTMDVRGGYSFMGEDMGAGSSTGFNDFRKFLDTYGIGDRLQINPGSLGSIGLQQQTGEGLQGLAAYQSQQNTGPGI